MIVVSYTYFKAISSLAYLDIQNNHYTCISTCFGQITCEHIRPSWSRPLNFWFMLLNNVWYLLVINFKSCDLYWSIKMLKTVIGIVITVAPVQHQFIQGQTSPNEHVQVDYTEPTIVYWQTVILWRILWKSCLCFFVKYDKPIFQLKQKPDY